MTHSGSTRRVVLALALMLATLGGVGEAVAKHHHASDGPWPGLANVTLLVVRHAEQPTDEDDPGLSDAGRKLAQAYATYFRHFEVDGAPVTIDTLITSADSDKSARPRLTLEPLSKATGLPIRDDFPNKDVKEAAHWIAAGQTHQAALIAWHHGHIAKLLDKLGADTADLLPDGTWPDDVYDWVIVLRYDGEGRLASAKRIVEPADLLGR